MYVSGSQLGWLVSPTDICHHFWLLPLGWRGCYWHLGLHIPQWHGCPRSEDLPASKSTVSGLRKPDLNGSWNILLDLSFGQFWAPWWSALQVLEFFFSSGCVCLWWCRTLLSPLCSDGHTPYSLLCDRLAFHNSPLRKWQVGKGLGLRANSLCHWLSVE